MLGLDHKQLIAIIGTRQPTPWAITAATSLASYCVAAGWGVVSGLATGIDAAAHQGALQTDRGSTIAILAHGLDLPTYPAENAPIARDIVAGGGVLLSEYADGIRAQRSSFVRRDRLQSGLSLGIIVVMAGVESGTMHTARFAARQGRPIGVVVHPDMSADSVSGNRLLLAQDAIPLGEGATRSARQATVSGFLSSLRV